MEMVQTAVTWISWFLAAYIVAVVIFLIANIGIQAVRTKSALWWYLVYSIVVVGMMLAGLQYLPSMFLESVNEGIEASQPVMERLTVNVQRIFNTAASGTGTTGSGANATAVPEPTATIDINVGGGLVTAVPVLTTPTLAPTGTPYLAPTGTPYEPDYSATADARLATVTAAAEGYAPTATPDPLHPPTPIIQP